jgi:hypothetical protein
MNNLTQFESPKVIEIVPCNPASFTQDSDRRHLSVILRKVKREEN